MVAQDRNVVTVQAGGATVDIAPTFARDPTSRGKPDSFEFPYLGEMLPASPGRIPDTSGEQHWIIADPRLSVRLMKRLDRRYEGTVVPLNRRLKAVNERRGAPLTSHHLECLVLEYFRQRGNEGENTHRARTNEFFHDLPWLLQSGVKDPLTGNRADSYLSSAEKGRAITWAKSLERQVAKADALATRGLVEEAAEAYSEIFEIQRLVGPFPWGEPERRHYRPSEEDPRRQRLLLSGAS